MYRIQFFKVLSTRTLANSTLKTCLQKNFQESTCRNSLQNHSRNLSESSKQVKVYNGILTPQIKAVKVFSLASSVGGLLAQPILLKQASNLGGMPIVIAVFGVVGFFTFVTPVLLHLITRKYVTEIRYDPGSDKYIATTINFFLMKKELEFTPKDVKVPDVGGMFTTFTVKNNPLFVDLRAFAHPSHYAKIMGFDKPVDFQLDNTEEKDSSEKKN